jgi:hypothetical protein
MRRSRKLVAGLLDAAVAALGTFLAGIVAVRELPTVSLAVYAVVFSASVLAMLLPRQLHYIPSQIAANLIDRVSSPMIGRDARRATGVNALTAAVVVVVALTLVSRAPIWVCLSLGITAGMFSIVSPIQDHIRAGLHLVDRHMSAAVLSIVTTAVVAVSSGVALFHPHQWWLVFVPFGGLFTGNLVSIFVGLRLLQGADVHTEYVPAALKDRFRFLFSEVALQAAWFACNYAVLFLLGAVALARLETARVVASPVMIVVTALLTFMGPAMLRKLKATPENPHGPRRDLLAIFGMLAGISLVYLAALALFGPVVATVLNKPFDLPLWAARLGSTLIEGSAGIAAFLVFAMGRTRIALANSFIAGGVGLGATVGLAFVLGPFALPLGQGLGMVYRLSSSIAITEREVRRDPEVPVPA